MNKYKNTPQDIHKRIYNFVVNCFRDVVKKIPKTVENIPIIQQISSSLTSMGANDQEADASATKKDFLAKYTIVRKETKETKYWLSFIRDSFLLSEQVVNLYIQECHEILMIVSKIINNTNKPIK
ncbi:MAG: four helix bundle protein [Candidatus Roizmanbacteria bacterium]|nr:four helix bundle protein [Candidatus Roizmanbacteria bacterium]